MTCILLALKGKKRFNDENVNETNSNHLFRINLRLLSFQISIQYCILHSFKKNSIDFKFININSKKHNQKLNTISLNPKIKTMRKSRFSCFVIISLALILSSCSVSNHSMKTPNYHIEFYKSDFEYSRQVTAEATSVRVLGIDWTRLFKC